MTLDIMYVIIFFECITIHCIAEYSHITVYNRVWQHNYYVIDYVDIDDDIADVTV